MLLFNAYKSKLKVYFKENFKIHSKTSQQPIKWKCYGKRCK